MLKSFSRAFTAVFGKVGRVASENVVVELLKTKCFLIGLLLYGLEAFDVHLQRHDLSR